MKIRYKVLIVILGIFVILLGFVGGVIINGTPLTPKVVDDNEDWMKYIDDDTLINNIALPGSHDAGTKGMPWLGQTQNLSVKEQLNIGVRYFDIRVNKKAEDDYVIYHSIINGDKFEPILKDIKEFIVNNPSETLFLDFQHFDNGAQEAVLSFVNDYLLDSDLLISNTSEKEDLEFISNLKLRDTRGKCIVFWGERTMATSYSYLFARNNDTCDHQKMCLDSYYDENYHKEYSPNEFIDKAIPFYFDDIKQKIDDESYKGIFVLQCQLTDGKLIFGPYSREKKLNRKINEYLKNDIIGDNEKIQLINIIMRDFLTREKADIIIALNYYKDNLNTLSKSTFMSTYNIG